MCVDAGGDVHRRAGAGAGVDPREDGGGLPADERGAEDAGGAGRGVTRREEILDVAEALLESEGAEALTMRRVAQEMGIRAPSLYKHVASKDDIEAGLQERALRVMASVLTGSDLREIMAVYRKWALAHRGLYELATR